MFTECKGVLRLSTPPRALLELSGMSFPSSELLCAYLHFPKDIMKPLGLFCVIDFNELTVPATSGGRTLVPSL